MPLRLFLIDAIGPFFRGLGDRRTNWSKIPFAELAWNGPERREQWDRIQSDLRKFARRVASEGFNAVTLDDLAHLATHPGHEPEVAERIQVFCEEFRILFGIVKAEGLEIFLTSDVLPSTPALDVALGSQREKLDAYYSGLVEQVLEDFPELSGLILRIGESDGQDVKDPIRTRLHLRSAEETNRMVKMLLPIFEKRGKLLILRTWTVGAHRIGDLIWHKRTLAETVEGITSPAFVISMKHGESDFFRYLPLNRAFFRVPHAKIVELQARREYEGAGEFPSFTGWDTESFARELQGAENLIGMSVWCQTGGWHRFRRLAFLEENDRDIWIRLNAVTAVRIFKDRLPVEEAVASIVGPEDAAATLELLRHADTVVRDLHYIPDFASQKLFFRRVRIPPLLHLYWDCLFVNHAVRKVLRHFVPDPEHSLRAGEAAFALFPHMLDLAKTAELPVDDIEHWRDFCHLLRLARRYYFLPYESEMETGLRAAKKAYKKRWPREQRQRFRIKLSFAPFRMQPHILGWLSTLLLRRRRGYRLIDRVFTLNLLGVMFRAFKPRRKKDMPKFLRKSAMGVETLFR